MWPRPCQLLPLQHACCVSAHSAVRPVAASQQAVPRERSLLHLPTHVRHACLPACGVQHDDAVTSQTFDLMTSITDGKQANGCPLVATMFVLSQGTGKRQRRGGAKGRCKGAERPALRLQLSTHAARFAVCGLGTSWADAPQRQPRSSFQHLQPHLKMAAAPTPPAPPHPPLPPPRLRPGHRAVLQGVRDRRPHGAPQVGAARGGAATRSCLPDRLGHVSPRRRPPAPLPPVPTPHT